MTAVRKPASNGRTIALTLLSFVSLVGISVSQGAAKEANQGTSATRASAAAAPALLKTAQVAAPMMSPAERILSQRINAIGASFQGDIGIAVKDVQTGYETAFDGNTFFPQQSVSKFWVALTALDKADQGLLSLEAPVTVRREDLTLFHQPIAAQVGASGYTTTLDSLLYRAITQSDNTCNDFVLWKAGGPDAVRAFLRAKGISGVRFGPGERMLQSRIAGMEWKPSYVGQNFYAARSALPTSVRKAAFEAYIKDPMDGATPLATVDALARLQRGELLSPYYTKKLLDTMTNTRTGAKRLKGGAAPGWKVAHKTGTGQVFGGEQAGYNDIGIVTGPDGRAYAVAVFIRRTSAPLGHRMETMQQVVRAIIDYSKGDHRVPQVAAPQQRVPQVQPAMTRQQAIAAAVQGLEEDGE